MIERATRTSRETKKGSGRRTKIYEKTREDPRKVKKWRLRQKKLRNDKRAKEMSILLQYF